VYISTLESDLRLSPVIFNMSYGIRIALIMGDRSCMTSLLIIKVDMALFDRKHFNVSEKLRTLSELFRCVLNHVDVSTERFETGYKLQSQFRQDETVNFIQILLQLPSSIRCS
jgi:hypothetical protein